MDNFTFEISLSVLNHLGRNLYRNFITVLGEAISNSWDADANTVDIYIDRKKKSLIIKDDGHGMTSDDFQDKFLKIGYSKRKGRIDKTESGRPFIGRKGIGKLALLSCAKRIHILSKTKETEFVGGTIDNRNLDIAIDDDITSRYPLETPNESLFDKYIGDMDQGTIIYFEDMNDRIGNRIEYIRKLIALFFRFSLIDDSFEIHLDDKPITLDELDELSQNTQFVWQINSLEDPYLKNKISKKEDHVKHYKEVTSSLDISGFIASVEKPSQLKIPNTSETVTVDLFVNGRLREKDLLKHIPSTRIVESYLYGQIHFNQLDDDADRFTSSREGVLSDDPLFLSFLKELNTIVQNLMKDWDKWRDELNQDGDPDNPRITRKQRKSKELFNTIIKEDKYLPPKSSENRSLVDSWVTSLGNEAQFNLSSYAECFVSENLLRKYIQEKKVALSKEAQIEITKWKKKEGQDKNKANISFEIRDEANDLHYLDMDSLANLADMHKEHKLAALSRDAIPYKPVRDAMAHTAILTSDAKQSLNMTYANIKARVKKLLE